MGARSPGEGKILGESSRDVNSWEIAFPGLDQDSRFHLSTWSELDRRQGHEGGGVIASQSRHCSQPMLGPHRHLRTIDGHSGRWRAQNVANRWGLAMGECDRGSAMADWPPDDGPGNAPPVGLRWISTSRADERAKQRAADCHVLRETNIG